MIQELTPIERKILDLLSDGGPHSIPELMECLEPFSSVVAMQMHLSRMRKKFAQSPYGIKCDESTHATTTYRLVMNLVSPYDGKQ